MKHPNDLKLSEWLELGDAASERVTRHLETCGRCNARLDDLLDQEGANLGDALRAHLEPPVDLEARIEERLIESASDAGFLGLVADVVGTGWRTALTLVAPDEDDQ